MNKNSKIGIVDSVIMILLCASSDAAEALADLGIVLPVIGPVLPLIAWFYGFIISAFMLFWLTMKGVSTRWFLGGTGLELIPFVNALPARTAAIVATIAEENLPEKAKVITQVTAKATGPAPK